MKNIIKKLVMMMGIIGLSVVLTNCKSDPPNKLMLLEKDLASALSKVQDRQSAEKSVNKVQKIAEKNNEIVSTMTMEDVGKFRELSRTENFFEITIERRKQESRLSSQNYFDVEALRDAVYSIKRL